MRNSISIPNSFTTKDGRTFSRSLYHNEMWIVTMPDGKFFAINCSDSYIKETYLK